MLFLTNSNMTKASPLYWKAKTIARACKSSKYTETLNLIKMVDDAILTSRQLKLLLYRDIMNRVPVYLFTNTESTLESIAS